MGDGKFLYSRVVQLKSEEFEDLQIWI